VNALDTRLVFGHFEIHTVRRRLLVGGRDVPVGARAFDVLLALVERRPALVTKNELFDAVWPGLVVEDNNLVVQIGTLRKLLGADAIATIPGRGYRFAALTAQETAADNEAGTSAAQSVALRDNLPAVLPRLIGRDDELAALGALLDAHRLITIVGAGGMGKTRLAERLLGVRRATSEHGVAWVELAGLSDSSLLAATIASALGVPTGPGDALQDLVTALAPLNIVVGLDNAEHLIDAVARVGQALLDAAPRARLIVTSQAPLRVSAERIFRLEPLALPDADLPFDEAALSGAVALFAERAQAADRHFELTAQNVATVAAICAQLDGLPLAIELAAARVSLLGLERLAASLDERLQLLTLGRRNAPQRQRTLRAALEWSHGLLDAAQAAVFRRLAVFVGSFSLEMAREIAADGPQHSGSPAIDGWGVVDVLDALIDRSLVAIDTAIVPRYRMLESARVYALEQLTAAGEVRTTRARHAAAVSRFLRALDEALLDGTLMVEEHLARLRDELGNLRAAYAWASSDDGDVGIAVEIASRASAFYDIAVESAAWLTAHQACVESGMDDGLAARYWLALSSPWMYNYIPWPRQADAASRAIALYEAMGQPKRVFFCLVALARHSIELDQGDAAVEALARARRIVRADWPPRLHVRLTRLESFMARRAGDMARALELFRKVVEFNVLAGEWSAEISARNAVADLLWEIAPIEEAAGEANAILEMLQSRPLGPTDSAMVYSNVVGILSEAGHVDQARQAAVAALPGIRRAKRFFLDVIVHLLWRIGEFDVAARLLGASDAFAAWQGAQRPVNERRLIEQVRPLLEAALTTRRFQQCLDDGAAFDEGQWQATVAAALSSATDRTQPRLASSA
jgi:predicted ATPase/DNA-binding winged helix-turn-helix (wHTH) protein